MTTLSVAIVAGLYGAFGLLSVALYGRTAPEAFRHRYGALFAVAVFLVWPLAVAFAVIATGAGVVHKVVGAIRDVRGDHRRQRGDIDESLRTLHGQRQQRRRHRR